MTAVVASPASSSVKISSKLTSIIVPDGAVRTTKGFVPEVFQKLANEWLGGTVDKYAGVETELVVSDISTLLVLAPPSHSTLQVEKAPWFAGGAHIDMRLMRTEAKNDDTKLFKMVQTVPAAHSKEVGVIAVAVPLVDVKRYVWETPTLDLIGGGWL